MNTIQVSDIKPKTISRKINDIISKQYDLSGFIEDICHKEIIGQTFNIREVTTQLSELLHEKRRIIRIQHFLGKPELTPICDEEAVLMIISAGPNYRLPPIESSGISKSIYEKHVKMYPRAAKTYGLPLTSDMIYCDPSIFTMISVPDHYTILALGVTNSLYLLNKAVDPIYTIAVIVEWIRNRKRINLSIVTQQLYLQYIDLHHHAKYLSEFPEDYEHYPTNILHEPTIITQIISNHFIKSKCAETTATAIKRKYNYNIKDEVLNTLRMLE